jgi:hypothetical protein
MILAKLLQENYLNFFFRTYEKNNVWSHVINEQFSWDKIIAVSFNQNFKEYFVLLGLIYNIMG